MHNILSYLLENLSYDELFKFTYGFPSFSFLSLWDDSWMISPLKPPTSCFSSNKNYSIDSIYISFFFKIQLEKMNSHKHDGMAGNIINECDYSIWFRNTKLRMMNANVCHFSYSCVRILLHWRLYVHNQIFPLAYDYNRKSKWDLC